jgi:hypothetical protein
MNQPTQEELREFWEHLGIKWHPRQYENRDWVDEWPALTLDNLFKWAYPKLLAKFGKSNLVYVLFKDWIYDMVMHEKDPAIALFRAIQQVIKEG